MFSRSSSASGNVESGGVIALGVRKYPSTRRGEVLVQGVSALFGVRELPGHTARGVTIPKKG